MGSPNLWEGLGSEKRKRNVSGEIFIRLESVRGMKASPPWSVEGGGAEEDIANEETGNFFWIRE
jgi:hypothetical protein